MDLNVFMDAYFKRVVPHLSGVVQPEKAIADIWTATKAMIASEDAQRSNEQVFKEVFFADAELKEEVLWPIFENFYANAFGDLITFTQPSPLARQICDAALAKGYQLAVATNPIFPEMAIRHRLNWAGVGDVPFALVTTMENMHFCKPNPKYYMEILEMLGVSADEAMMFGNDVQEDGVAGKVGMKTFLVTDNLIDNQRGDFTFDYTGSLAQALEFVRQLPKVGDYASA